MRQNSEISNQSILQKYMTTRRYKRAEKLRRNKRIRPVYFILLVILTIIAFSE